MKLNITEPFELTVGEDTYEGEFAELTKKQSKSIDKDTPKDTIKENNKVAKKIERIERKIENAKNLDDSKLIKSLYSQLDKLEDIQESLLDKIESYSIEDMYKQRMTLSLSGDDKDAIMTLGETYGYQKVFDTIIRDIRERNAGN